MISWVNIERSLATHLATKLGALQVYKPGNTVTKPTEHEFVVPRIVLEDVPAEGGPTPLEIEFLCVLPTLKTDEGHLRLPALVDKVRPHVISTREAQVAAAAITDPGPPVTTVGALLFGSGRVEPEYGTEITIEGQKFPDVDICRITVACLLAPSS